MKSIRLLLPATGLFAVLALAILYGVDSWQKFFFTGLAQHWDPKLMGEWMAWNAHSIRHGHFLLPDYNANFFYPHSYTLAFSELLWPESFVYGLFYFLSGNLFFSFNATMLFFWSLSGMLLFYLLRSLGISFAVSALGGLIYCLMPYRMPYYVEFNMVLVFIFPMMILLLNRWLKDPSWQNALWFCLGFFVSATSCLYYTIMAIIMMLFVFLAFVASERELLRSRKFYFSSGLIAFGVLVISVIYLYPYYLLRTQAGYKRSISDYLEFYAQPMQYLDTGSAAFLKWIKIPPSHFTETFLFPGTVLSLLTLIFLLHGAIGFFRRYSAEQKIARHLAAAKFILWSLFWSAILIHAYWDPVGWLKPFDPYLYHIAFGLILLYIAGLFFLPDEERTVTTVLAGLSAAAVLCFFISFGPFISIGPDHNLHVLARGPFLDLASWNPLFSAVRSLTRFSIVILTYLTIAGCYVLDRLIRKQGKIVWAIPILAAILVYEARVMVPYKFEDDTAIINSPVIQQSENLPDPYVLLQLPIAVRDAEANIVMTSIGRFPLLVDGWSGFAPPYYQQLFSWENGKWKLDEIFPWVSDIWPPAYLLLDRKWVALLELGWHKPFPREEVEKAWDLIAQDRKYALYRQKPKILASDEIKRLVRTDMLHSHPRLCLDAHSIDTTPASFLVRLNHKVVKTKIPLSTEWKHYVVLLPEADMGNIKGEEIDIQLISAAHSHHWQVKNIDFKSKS